MKIAHSKTRLSDSMMLGFVSSGCRQTYKTLYSLDKHGAITGICAIGALAVSELDLLSMPIVNGRVIFPKPPINMLIEIFPELDEDISEQDYKALIIFIQQNSKKHRFRQQGVDFIKERYATGSFDITLGNLIVDLVSKLEMSIDLLNQFLKTIGK